MRRTVQGVLILVVLALSAKADAAVAAEPIAVIVAASEVKRSVTLEDLALIYRRKKLYWPDGSRVVPINLPASSAVRRAFSEAVFSEPVEASESYWNTMYFQGVTPPFVAASDEAVLRFVTQSSNAVGYVPLCSVDKRVSILLVIDGSGVLTSAQNAQANCGH